MSIMVIPLHMKSIPTKNFIYIVYETTYREAIIVDPNGDIELIKETLLENKLDLKAILITHTHFDHIGLVKPLLNMFHCKIYVSSAEYRQLLIDENLLSIIENEIPFKIANISVAPILTPGHTLGSICYMIDENIFTGDTLFIEGCGACIGENSNPALLFASLSKLKNYIPSSTKVFPGHSYKYYPGKSFKFLMANNIYMQFSDEQEHLFISYRMRKSKNNLFDFY